MNTPITDKFSDYPQDFLTSDKVIHADLARRLEIDRAALMEAVDTLTLVVGLTPIKGNLEALLEALHLARAALTTARANFPTE
jgi:hypothetical protein